jgi:hypothetical protein
MDLPMPRLVPELVEHRRAEIYGGVALGYAW